MDVVRHFTRLSQLNYAVDIGFYPWARTMKYNPKVNSCVATSRFLRIHPYQPEEMVQGALKLIYDLEKIFSRLPAWSGPHCSLPQGRTRRRDS